MHQSEKQAIRFADADRSATKNYWKGIPTMTKYINKDIESNEKLAALVSEYLNADHSQKAQKARADKAKAAILAEIGAEPSERCNYTVINKTGKKKFVITFSEQVKDFTSEEAAQEIKKLEERIKELKATYGIASFKGYSMREREA